MNKRPLMQGGLPAKPNYIGPAAPAPPLPSGPPPQQAQQAGYPQDQAAAAHAAAWAAYYQVSHSALTVNDSKSLRFSRKAIPHQLKPDTLQRQPPSPPPSRPTLRLLQQQRPTPTPTMGTELPRSSSTISKVLLGHRNPTVLPHSSISNSSIHSRRIPPLPNLSRATSLPQRIKHLKPSIISNLSMRGVSSRNHNILNSNNNQRNRCSNAHLSNSTTSRITILSNSSIPLNPNPHPIDRLLGHPHHQWPTVLTSHSRTVFPPVPSDHPYTPRKTTSLRRNGRDSTDQDLALCSHVHRCVRPITLPFPFDLHLVLVRDCLRPRSPDHLFTSEQEVLLPCLLLAVLGVTYQCEAVRHEVVVG